jgi:conjugal transfer mating pair stabilization protein TraG
MSYRKIYSVLVFTLFLISFSDVYAATSTQETTILGYKETGAAIHTYGGGKLLEKVFNAIAMILYGDAKTGIGKAFNGILRIALAIGGFSSICLAFFREKFDTIIKSFFLPAVGITCAILIPRTTVYIQDHLASKAESTEVAPLIRVDNVPFFLGKFATLSSTVSYQLELLFTGVTHGVNDKTYNWTGNIYAGREAFKAKKCRIANPVLEDNFREFCRECVFRDIGIGLYSKDELVKTPNILEFLERKTSNIRTVFYKEPASAKSASTFLGALFDKDQSTAINNQLESKMVTCREAMKKMNQLFGGKEANTKEMVFGEIGSQVGFLLGQQKQEGKEIQNLIKQQIAIDTLKEELPGNLSAFSAKRAEILQKENQKTLGALGVYSIVSMRNFFEATIYMVFPLVILISLLSFGITPFIQWLQFILWINTWPVFFIVVNFMLSSIWDFRKTSVLRGDTTLNLFNSEGLADLYSSMESIAAVALAFIPYLSWILLKGGVSQMVQLASSLMAPAQGAASTAAAEKTSGNYSFGNVSLDSVSGYNASMFKQSYSGSLSQDSIGIDTGTQTTTYTPQGEMFLKQGDSYLREGISRSHAFNSSLQNSLNNSESASFESSQAVSSGITETTNKAVGLTDAISRHIQSGQNYNTQETSSTHQAYQYLLGATEDYANTHGVGRDTALKTMLSAGIGGNLWAIKGDAQGSLSDGVSNYESQLGSTKSFDSKTFQDQLQVIKNLSQGEVASVLGSEDAKFHEDFVESLSNTESSMDQWRAAHSKQEAYSELSSYASSENISVQQNLNQRFVEFLSEKFDRDPGLVSDAADLPHNNPRKIELIDEFVKDFLPSKVERPHLEESYHNTLQETQFNPRETYDERKEDVIDRGEVKTGRSSGSTSSQVEALKSKIEMRENEIFEQKDRISDRLGEQKKSTDESYNSKMRHYYWEKGSGPNVLKEGFRDGLSAAQNLGKWAKNIYNAQYGNNSDSSKK